MLSFVKLKLLHQKKLHRTAAEPSINYLLLFRLLYNKMVMRAGDSHWVMLSKKKYILTTEESEIRECWRVTYLLLGCRVRGATLRLTGGNYNTTTKMRSVNTSQKKKKYKRKKKKRGFSRAQTNTLKISILLPCRWFYQTTTSALPESTVLGWGLVVCGLYTLVHR